MRTKFRWVAFLAVLLLAGALVVAGVTSAAGSKAHVKGSTSANLTFDNIVKLNGSTWFGRMNVGIKAFTKKTGVKVNQTGPAQPTAEGQVSLITSLIAQHPTVIGVDPNDVGALEGVLGQAQKAGIVVVSQEAATMKNTDFDLEPFSNAAYGQAMMDQLATCMHGQGQYAAFVGSLTTAAHMQWVSAALAKAKAKYKGITRVGSGPFVSNESQTTAYQLTKQILAKYPNIKGFEGSASIEVPGIAKAVHDAGLSGKVCIVGTSLPSLTKQYINDGTIYKVFLWDPALTGEATMYGALMLAQHKKITVGTNLHVPGYTHIQRCAGKGTTKNCYQGYALLEISKANIGKYNF